MIRKDNEQPLLPGDSVSRKDGRVPSRRWVRKSMKFVVAMIIALIVVGFVLFKFQRPTQTVSDKIQSLSKGKLSSSVSVISKEETKQQSSNRDIKAPTGMKEKSIRPEKATQKEALLNEILDELLAVTESQPLTEHSEDSPEDTKNSPEDTKNSPEDKKLTVIIDGVSYPISPGQSITINTMAISAMSADEISQQRALIKEYLRTHPLLSEKERKEIDDLLKHLDKLESGGYKVPAKVTITPKLAEQ
jgi:hypothetical protein